MSSYYIDLDGVFFRFGSQEPNKGFVQLVNYLIDNGHQVIFTTARLEENNNDPNLDLPKTRKALEEAGCRYTQIIGGLTSPRYLFNDEGANAVQWDRNYPCDVLEVSQRVLNALKYLEWESSFCLSDADDYIQTILVANSLIDYQGFDHVGFLKTFRHHPKHWQDLGINPCGCIDLTPNNFIYRSAMYELYTSKDPLYRNKDGYATDGASMRVSPIAAFYRKNIFSLAEKIKQITEISHNLPEAILSALFVALQFRRIYLQDNPKSIRGLLNDFLQTYRHLNIISELKIQSIIFRGAEIIEREKDPYKNIHLLAEHVGLEHWSWCCPIAATLWSLTLDENYLSVKNDIEFDYNSHPRYLHIQKKTLTPLKKEYEDLYNKFAEPINKVGRTNVDGDTFMAIAFSLAAAQYGFTGDWKSILGDNLEDIAFKLALSNK